MRCRITELNGLSLRFLRFSVAVVAAVVVLSGGSPAFSQERFENIVFTSDTTLRAFVGQHLGDPDLWPYVLEINEIADPADLESIRVIASS